MPPMAPRGLLSLSKYWAQRERQQSPRNTERGRAGFYGQRQGHGAQNKPLWRDLQDSTAMGNELQPDDRALEAAQAPGRGRCGGEAWEEHTAMMALS